MDEATFKRIKKVLGFVWKSKRSDFYREKYKKAGFDDFREIKAPDDFSRLPALTRDELASTNPFDRFYMEDNGMMEFSSTSGTTLREPVLSLRPVHLPRKKFTRESGRVLLFNNASRVFYLNQPMRMAARFINMREEWKNLPVVVIAGDPYNLTGSAYLAGGARADALVTSASLAIEFAQYLDKHYDRSKIRFIRLIGETITEARTKVLRDLYPNAKIDSIYALSETRFLGRLCGFLNNLKPLYHANPNVFYEIVDGELVVTNLDVGDTGTPLIRYKTGDAIAWAKGKCGCGRRGRQFRMLGRIGGDFIKVAGGEIWEDVVGKVVARVPEIIDFRLDVSEERVDKTIKPKIVFEILLRGRIDNPELLAEKLASGIPISPRHTLLDAEKAGLILPLETRIVESFPRKNKAGRIIFHGD